MTHGAGAIKAVYVFIVNHCYYYHHILLSKSGTSIFVSVMHTHVKVTQQQNIDWDGKWHFNTTVFD